MGVKMAAVAERTGVSTALSHQVESLGSGCGGTWQQLLACATALRSSRSSGVRRDDVFVAFMRSGAQHYRGRPSQTCTDEGVLAP